VGIELLLTLFYVQQKRSEQNILLFFTVLYYKEVECIRFNIMRNIFLNMADFAEFSFSFVYFDYCNKFAGSISRWKFITLRVQYTTLDYSSQLF
jgi:hypothetical protein